MVWLESFTLHSTNLLNHVMIMLLQKIFSFLFASFAIFAVCLLFFVSTFCITFWTVSMFTHLILLMKKKYGIFYIYWVYFVNTRVYVLEVCRSRYACIEPTIFFWKICCIRAPKWAADFIYFLPIKNFLFPNYVRANEISCTNYL